MENGNDWVAKNYLAEFCKQKLEQTGQEIIINGKYVLDPQGHKEKSRKRTNNKWFETQDSISYWEDFDKPYMAYCEIGFEMNACLIPKQTYINNKAYLVSGRNLNFLLLFFNSKLFNRIILKSANLTGGKGVDFMSKIHVPYLDDEIQERVEYLLRGNASEEDRDSFIYDLYSLSSNERDFVQSLYPPLQQ